MTAASNKFKIDITAVNRTVKPIRDVKDTISKIFRPLQQIKATTGAIGKELGFERMGKVLGTAGDAATTLAESLGGVRLGIAGIAGAGIVGGMAALLSGAKDWASQGREINRTAASLGVAASRLQVLRNLAKNVGFEFTDMDTALGGLQSTIYDARWNQNQRAFAFMHAHGMSKWLDRHKGIDPATALMDASRAIYGLRTKGVTTQKDAAQLLGVGSIFDIVRRGPAYLKAHEAEAARAYLMNKQQLDSAQHTADAVSRLGTTMEGLKTQVEGSVAKFVHLDDALDGINGFLSRFLPGSVAKSAGATRKTGMGGAGTDFWHWLSYTAGVKIDWKGNGQHIAGGWNSMLADFRNNPGNLRRWGSYPIDTGFARFPNVRTGLSAMAQQLLLYGSRGKLNLHDIISTYAPANDRNDVPAYIKHVMQQTGIKSEYAPINLRDWRTLAGLMQAMVVHEQGTLIANPDDIGWAARQRLHVTVDAAPGLKVKTKTESPGRVHVNHFASHTAAFQ